MTYMNKLVCSLKSGLPNEIDFAMSVATLLANSDNFIWSKDYPLVDAICSSLHVFVCVCGCQSNCYCYPRFWHQILKKNSNNRCLHSATIPPDMGKVCLHQLDLTHHDSTDFNKIYKRIKTAGELIKQFSMTCGIDDKNLNNLTSFQKSKKPKASSALLKFVNLLLYCDDAQLNFIGLDILSNTASKLSKVHDNNNEYEIAELIQMLHDYCTESISHQDGDVYIVSRSLEVVSRLVASSNKRISSSITSKIVEKNLVTRVEQFLTSHSNVNLFLSGLECCYRISRHSPHLITSRRLMKILVNLLDFDDGRFFTQNAIKRIKLMDEDQDDLLCLDQNMEKPQQNFNHQRQITRSQPLPQQPKQVHQIAPQPKQQLQPQPAQPVKEAQQPPEQPPLQQTAPPNSEASTKVEQPPQQNNVDKSEPREPTKTNSDEPSKPQDDKPQDERAKPTQAEQPKQSETEQNQQQELQTNEESKQPEPEQPKESEKTPLQETLVEETSTEPQKPESEPKPAVELLVPQEEKQPPQVPQEDKQPPLVPQEDKQPLLVPQEDKQPPLVPQEDKQPPLVPQEEKQPQQEPQSTGGREFTCQWENCSAKFSEAKLVCSHVFNEHIAPMDNTILTSCVWSSPEGSGPGCRTKRPKFSLLTHLRDFHCNPSALERAQPVKPPEHPGYAPNAAILAIRRHANSRLNKSSHDINSMNPISVSVRLTAALIVRNLATESPEMKHALENHESLLSEICMTNGRDESKIIAECLSLLSANE